MTVSDSPENKSLTTKQGILTNDKEEEVSSFVEERHI